MKKVVAEIIAGIIPHKPTRNRWRGILRYGPLKALKLKKRMKDSTQPPQHYVALCAIAKNEGPYFKEWIEWHRKMGVEKFYIYDNESTDNTRSILEPYMASGLVDYQYWPGKKQQLSVYDDCIERHRLDTRWLGIIDLDEFVVPVKYSDIPSFLKPLEEYSSVEINWLVYGSSGQKKYVEENLMSRFKFHSDYNHYLNRHVKSFFNPRKVCTMIGCHEVARIEGKASDSHGNSLKKGFRDRTPQHDIIKINHYAIKSLEEFMQKRARGRARTNDFRSMDYFKEYDLNDIYDD